jgi:hypothetical protein
MTCHSNPDIKNLVLENNYHYIQNLLSLFINDRLEEIL